MTTLAFDSQISADLSKEATMLQIELELLRSSQLDFDSYSKDPIFSYIDGEPVKNQIFQRKFFDGKLVFEIYIYNMKIILILKKIFRQKENLWV